MVRISICGMCKHLKDKKEMICPAFPNGRTFEQCFPYWGEECGNGFQFEPEDDYIELCTERIMRRFARSEERNGGPEIVIPQH